MKGEAPAQPPPPPETVHTRSHSCTHPQPPPHTHHLLTGLLPIHKALGDGIGCQDLVPEVGGEGWGGGEE